MLDEINEEDELIANEALAQLEALAPGVKYVMLS